MGLNSKISWTNHTANLWWGCTKVHEGCDNCYAEKLSNRWGNKLWGPKNSRKEIRGVWDLLDIMQKSAYGKNEMHTVFVGSMMDIFEKPMPIIDSAIPEYTTGVFRNRLFDQINMGWYPSLMFLFLTKRPSNINKCIPESWKKTPPKNVMFGVSISTMENAATLIPQLLKVNGKRFLSVEPQIEEISFRWASWHNWKDDRLAQRVSTDEGKTMLVRDQYDGIKGIDWIIQGGESGPKNSKRIFKLEWAEKMRNQCKEAGIPYFFKQIDGIKDIPEEYDVKEFPSFMKPL